jgi:hypothetical protein
VRFLVFKIAFKRVDLWCHYASVVRVSAPSGERETTMSLRLDAAYSYVIVPFTGRGLQSSTL